MDELRTKVSRVRRQLLCQQWLDCLPWSLAICLALATLAMVVGRYFPLGVSDAAWAATGAGAGLLVALVWALTTWRSSLDAAIEFDRRYGLKERVSTALSLDPARRETPIGQAVVADAIAQAAKVNVREGFRLRTSRWLLLPLAPGALALAVALAFHPRIGEQAQAGANEASGKRVQASLKQLERGLAKKKEEAERQGLERAEELINKLEEATKNEAKAGKADQKQALVKLHDLTKELAERRSQLGSSQEIKEQLAELRNLPKGPADRFAAQLRDGQFKQAAEELSKLGEQLREGNLNAEQLEQLAKQLAQMQERLEKMVEAQKEQEKELERQVAEKRAAGQNDEADQLDRQLQEMKAKHAAQQKRAQEMAQKLGKCSKCLGEGQKREAAEALEEMEADLGSMSQELAEAELLESTLDEIGDVKQSMNCQECNGQGCKACQAGAKQRRQSNQGWGTGRGQGQGRDEDLKAQFYDSKVKQKVGAGASVVVDRVEGPNTRGGVQQEIQTQFESAKSGSAHPLTGQRLPKNSEEHAREYFDSLREGRQTPTGE